MSEPDARAIHEILRQLIDVAPEDRNGWLARRFPDDPELCARLVFSVATDEPRTAISVTPQLPFKLPNERSISVAPTQVGRYEIVRPLGEGGMGRVFLARDPDLNRHVAVKLLHDSADQEWFRQRLWREAQAIGRLRHPNVVTIFDVQEHENRLFIVMEYVSGRSIAQIIEDTEPMTIAQKLQIIEGICSGLESAHEAGLIHRDIKPANIIVGNDGVPKVLDFGIAKATGHVALSATRLTTSHAIIGTIGYMSPEQLSGATVDHRSDIFSTAAVAYELFTSKKPFGTKPEQISRRILNGEVIPVSTFAPAAPQKLENIVGKGLAVRPEDRYQTISAMRHELAAVRVGLRHAEDSPNGDAPIVEPRSRVSLQAGVGAGALVCLLITISFFAYGSRGASNSPPLSNLREAQPVPSTITSEAKPLLPKTTPRPSETRIARPLRHERKPSARPETEPQTSSPFTTDNASLLGTNSVIPIPEAAVAPPLTVDNLTREPSAEQVTTTPFEERETASIERTLHAFEAAFDNLSTAALKAVQPSLTASQLAVWDRAFLENSTYRVTVQNPRITWISKTRARVDCVLSQALSPKSGAPRLLTNRATIVLDSVEGAWVITRVLGPGWQ